MCQNRLECADFIEREETEDDWTDDTAIWYGTETISGIPGVGTFAVVARNEELAFGYDGVYFTRGVLFGAVGIGGAPLGIVDETVGMFVVIDSHDAVFYGDTFAREGDDALDDILITYVGWYIASHGVLYALGFVFGNFGFIFV